MARAVRRSAARPTPIPAPANRELHPAILRLIVAMAEADEAEDWARQQAEAEQRRDAAHASAA